MRKLHRLIKRNKEAGTTICDDDSLGEIPMNDMMEEIYEADEARRHDESSSVRAV